MVKRLLDANASDFRGMASQDLIESIRISEGRVVVAEVVATSPPLVDKLSNVELAAGMGADLILLNLYDLSQPQVSGFPDQGGDSPASRPAFGKFPSGRGVTLSMIKEWIGRPVGINLEPIENPEFSASARLATPENAQAAVEAGVDFIVLTGNPYTGVTQDGLARALNDIRQRIGARAILLVGKIHGAGIREKSITSSGIEALAKGGADGIVLPAPGTAPSTTVESVRSLVEAAHEKGLLVMNGIGTSQEGASLSTIEQIALMSKMTGADMHHIGDAGIMGMAVPENISAMSIALRGRRHTWHRMAASLRR
jgi:putative N-acetylmannosamine-6-phosphate epimerase